MGRRREVARLGFVVLGTAYSSGPLHREKAFRKRLLETTAPSCPISLLALFESAEERWTGLDRAPLTYSCECDVRSPSIENTEPK